MQDRVPVNPGRVLITPENGSAAYYATMTRADNPTQEGTPLNKANLLKDATAALFGLGADAVPDDVFGVLSRFQNGLGNEYVWAKQKMEWTWALGSANVATFNNLTITYGSEIEIVDGVVNIKDYTTTNNNNDLYHKYFYISDSSNVIFVGYCTGVSGSTVNYNRVEVSTSLEVVGYVNSPDPAAYPIDDEFTYTALGQLGNKVQIATGSYTGTGTIGESNPNSLTFDFAPKLLVLFNPGGLQYVSTGGGAWAYLLVSVNNLTVSTYGRLYNTTGGSYSNGPATNQFTFNGNTVLWFVSFDPMGRMHPQPDCQLNESGKEYPYLAIGLRE